MNFWLNFSASFILRVVQQIVQQLEESTDRGYECFEGPFEQTGVTDVLTQCQAGGQGMAMGIGGRFAATLGVS